jgi:hypothetical protein
MVTPDFSKDEKRWQSCWESGVCNQPADLSEEAESAVTPVIGGHGRVANDKGSMGGGVWGFGDYIEGEKSIKQWRFAIKTLFEEPAFIGFFRPML